jgi:hypothetical protein
MKVQFVLNFVSACEMITENWLKCNLNCFSMNAKLVRTISIEFNREGYFVLLSVFDNFKVPFLAKLYLLQSN